MWTFPSRFPFWPSSPQVSSEKVSLTGGLGSHVWPHRHRPPALGPTGGLRHARNTESREVALRPLTLGAQDARSWGTMCDLGLSRPGGSDSKTMGSACAAAVTSKRLSRRWVVSPTPRTSATAGKDPGGQEATVLGPRPYPPLEGERRSMEERPARRS